MVRLRRLRRNALLTHMKIRYINSSTTLTVHITNHSPQPAMLFTSWRYGNARTTVFHSLIYPEATGKIVYDKKLLGVTHQFHLVQFGRTRNRHIPSRYLNLGSEHD